jgi:hypothetical protein
MPIVLEHHFTCSRGQWAVGSGGLGSRNMREPQPFDNSVWQFGLAIQLDNSVWQFILAIQFGNTNSI